MRTQNIPFLNTKKENHPKLSQICIYGICSKGPKNEFETAVVNEPSVFEPLKFYCTLNTSSRYLSSIFYSFSFRGLTNAKKFLYLISK